MSDARVYDHLNELFWKSDVDGLDFPFEGSYGYIIASDIEGDRHKYIRRTINKGCTRFVPKLGVFVPPFLREAPCIQQDFWGCFEECRKFHKLGDEDIHPFVQRDGNKYYLGVLFRVQLEIWPSALAGRSAVKGFFAGAPERA